jgi:uncharacterized membrane protein
MVRVEMPEHATHRTRLFWFLTTLFVLAMPLALEDWQMTAAFAVFYATVWLAAVLTFIGLIRADTKLAKAIGVSPPVPIWLIYALGLWPIGTIWLDIKGTKRAA